jgi:hypothetical protein
MEREDWMRAEVEADMVGGGGAVRARAEEERSSESRRCG